MKTKTHFAFRVDLWDGASRTRAELAIAAIGIGLQDAAPWQNGHAERLIGSIRRECLDHVLVLGETHLRQILSAYADYYNRARTHLALAKDAPVSRPVQTIGSIVAIPFLGGLHHQYARLAANRLRKS
jgi:hypothetical protein